MVHSRATDIRRNGATAQQVREAVAARRVPMVRLLTELASIETPSDEPRTLEPAFALLARELRAVGMRVRRVATERSAGWLLARPEHRRRGPAQLLIGHCDTVWPVGTLASMPVREREGRVYGPGVYDMKAGLVQMLCALRVLRQLNVSLPLRPVVLISSDEETGSVESEPVIRRLAATADRALVLEPSLGATGRLKTERKGVAQYEIEVEGVAAHAGLDPDRGVSAILEMSRLVLELFALNVPDQGVSVNVGTLRGGTRANVIAARACAQIDVRAPTSEQAERIDRAIHALEASRPQLRISVRRVRSRPPMRTDAAAERLWHAARSAAAALGFELQRGCAGGASDGNFTSQYCPTLDGLGAVGEGAHARHESVRVEAMVQRAALLAMLLQLPATAELPQVRAEDAGTR